MEGHHLILGELTDLLTGEIRPDTHDERYRQKIARMLVRDKGFSKADITAGRMVTVRAGEAVGKVPLDYIVSVEGMAAMIVKYGPGSIVTRHRPALALALARIVAPCVVPIVVVTNGESADLLDGDSGQYVGAGFSAIPDAERLREIINGRILTPVSERRREMAGRIVYAFEIDGACPCDTTVCRLNAETD